MEQLTIVSSCCGPYSRYLREWGESIVGLNRKPGAVRLFTHGDDENRAAGAAAIAIVSAAGIDARHEHESARLDYGTARNRAVAMSTTEWVMHLDCDDMVMAHCLDDVAAIAPGADVVALGYERSGDLKAGPSNRRRLYSDTTGLKALDASAPCSGVSPFRRSFWERSPYRSDMLGAWDTALWIGFARLGARFRATRRPCFWYRQHADSIFNKRRTTFDWIHADTVARLKSLRRGDAGVAVVVPLSSRNLGDRAALWDHVRAFYATNFPDWTIVEGFDRTVEWRKGAAVADALARCKASTIVIADADCLVPAEAIREAVDRVADGRAPWAVPHRRVLRLNRQRTVAWLAGDVGKPNESRDLARSPYDGFSGGGILVVPRVGYEATGGIPLAFRGWGGEDQALSVILDTCLGRHWRGSADLVHLWHEPQASKRTGNGNQFRYQALSAAAREGKDALLRAVSSASASIPGRPWARPAAPGAPALTRRERQSFLLRRQRGTDR
jgi:hypothetical protein